MRNWFAGAVALALMLGAGGASAHHSFAMFDQQKTLTLTGSVKEFQWTNPHCYIQLMVPDKDGKPVEWSMEMGAPMYLYARGWRPGTIKPGDKITIAINPLRNGRPGGVVVKATAADGKPLGKSV
jgi:hypothetical protein